MTSVSERREREARARSEKEQWGDGKVARKLRDRAKERRSEPPPVLPDLPLHPTAGGRDEVAHELAKAIVTARRRGQGSAARKARSRR